MSNLAFYDDSAQGWERAFYAGRLRWAMRDTATAARPAEVAYTIPHGPILT